MKVWNVFIGTIALPCSTHTRVEMSGLETSPTARTDGSMSTTTSQSFDGGVNSYRPTDDEASENNDVPIPPF